jgi:hypothetical protein
MAKRTLFLAVAVIAAAFGVGAGVLSATQSDSHPSVVVSAPAVRPAPVVTPSERVLHYTSTVTKSAYVDSRPTGFSAGDLLTEHARWSQGGVAAGTMALTATVTLRTSKQTGEVMFTAVARLKQGQLALTGVFDVVPQNQTFDAAVTGGTGAFRNVRGDAVFRQTSGDTSQITLTLSR